MVKEQEQSVKKKLPSQEKQTYLIVLTSQPLIVVSFAVAI